MKFTELLKDNTYFSTLMNGPCKVTGFDDEGTDVPIKPDWIDDEASDKITSIYRGLLPDGNPYFSTVKVVRDPETERNGTVVNEDRHRTRYIILNILPECSFPYDWNYGFVHATSIFALSGLEMSRASMEASRQWMKVMMEKEPKAMLLNNARLQWASLYVGKKPWNGTTKMSQHKGLSLDDEPLELDSHFMNARESDDPLLHRLIEAFDADNPTPLKDTAANAANATD